MAAGGRLWPVLSRSAADAIVHGEIVHNENTMAAPKFFAVTAALMALLISSANAVPPPTTAVPLPRSNMTAPENNFCCATDLAPMSEPGAYGVGTIGTVSYRFDGQTVQTKQLWPSTRIRNSCSLGRTCRSSARLNLEPRPKGFMTAV